MRRSLILMVVLFAGCAERMVGIRSSALSSTVDDLYYTQVLNNLAMMQANPASLPYFSVPTQGTSQVTRTAQGMYQPTWNLITSDYFLGRWLLNMHQAQLQATGQISESWQTAPTSNPDLINLLKCAYHKTMGISDPNCEYMLNQFYTKYTTLFKEQYLTAFHPGWYCVGGKHEVPKNACYVGHCGKTYVWVMPGNMEELSRFTLAVLDIVTVNPTAQWPWQRTKELMENPPLLTPRTVPMMPYPAPPSPPGR